MTNSESGNRPRPAAHQPGDRVRIRHNPAQNAGFSVEQNRARAAGDGQIGSIRERTVTNAYRVAPPGSTERGAWFEADELEPVVTDADGLPVGGPSPLVDRHVSELRAGVLAIVDALEAKLSIANAEAARWHAAAQEAQGEARDARAARLAGEAERDALRAACEAVVGPAVGVSAEALAHGVKEALAAQMAAVMRTADHRCADARRIAALEARVTAVRAAWGKMRALLLGLHRPLGAVWLDALEAVDAALGGAVDPDLIPCELTVTFSRARVSGA